MDNFTRTFEVLDAHAIVNLFLLCLMIKRLPKAKLLASVVVKYYFSKLGYCSLGWLVNVSFHFRNAFLQFPSNLNVISVFNKLTRSIKIYFSGLNNIKLLLFFQFQFQILFHFEFPLKYCALHVNVLPGCFLIHTQNDTFVH